MSRHGPAREPFTRDEQALARELAQLPSGTPSAGLDARIQAQARAAVGASSCGQRPAFSGTRPARHRRAGLATAASLLVAAGLVWQLDLAQGPSPADIDTGPGMPAGERSGPPVPASAAMPPPDRSARSAATHGTPAIGRGRGRAAAGQSDGEDSPLAAAAEGSRTAPTAPVTESAEAEPGQAGPGPTRPTAPAAVSGSGVEAAAEAGQPALADNIAPPKADTGAPARGSPAQLRSFQAAVDEVRRLLAAGRPRAACAALAQLLARYPDAPLPPDLAALRESAVPESGPDNRN